MVYSAYEYHFLRKVQWVCTSTMVARCLAVLYWTMKINRVEYYTHFRMWRWVYVNALAYASSSSGRGSVSVCVRVLNGHNDQSYWSHKSNVHTLLNNNYSKIHIKILLVNFLRRRWRGYVDVHLEWLWSHLTACIRHHTFNRLWRLWIALKKFKPNWASLSRMLWIKVDDKITFVIGWLFGDRSRLTIIWWCGKINHTHHLHKQNNLMVLFSFKTNIIRRCHFNNERKRGEIGKKVDGNRLQWNNYFIFLAAAVFFGGVFGSAILIGYTQHVLYNGLLDYMPHRKRRQ